MRDHDRYDSRIPHNGVRPQQPAADPPVRVTNIRARPADISSVKTAIMQAVDAQPYASQIIVISIIKDDDDHERVYDEP